MSKRKDKAISNMTAVKRCRLFAGDEPDDTTNHLQSSSDNPTLFATEDVGLIESITLKNFMCHHLLGPFHFGPNVNFIIGNNGSGKSAILTALVVGLGGKASVTNRGVSLKDFVKTGENIADITIKLRNRGPEAYKRDVYGDSISIMHRITNTGSRNCRLKSESGQIISNNKEELTAILDHFNIQLDNPVVILNQEMSKQFLQSKSDSEKYKLFMKATLLNQMKVNYVHIRKTKSLTRHQVEIHEQCLKKLRQELFQKKARYESLSSMRKTKTALENLHKQMAWSLVGEKEQLVQQLKEDIQKEENNYKHQDNLQLCQTEVMQVEKTLQGLKSSIYSLKEEQIFLSKHSLWVKKEVRISHRFCKVYEFVYFCALNKLKHSQQEQKLLQEKMNKASETLKNRDAEDNARRQKTLSGLKEQLAELEEKCSELNDEINKTHQAVFSGKKERSKIRLEESSILVMCEAKLQKKKELIASQSNKLGMFAQHIPGLLNDIAKAYSAGRFIKRPIGPIGMCVSSKDSTLAVAVESCLQNNLMTFCCDNYKDEAVLQDLMSRYDSNDTRPEIIVSSFSGKPLNTTGQKVYHPDYPCVLDVISTNNPVITNCLIDMRQIESILIIKDKTIARRIMQQTQPLKNCKEAFTVEGDQVFPDRYYSSTLSETKCLEINILESEMENHKAQLSRFHVQLNSVTDDILDMEKKLKSTNMTMKMTMTFVNQVKMMITELENIAQEQREDISYLDELIQENQRKIDAEKQTADEAKTALNMHQKKSQELETMYTQVKNQIDQLSEQIESFQDEQLKLEAECAKHEQNLKILEKKLQMNKDNIQVRKSELAQREEELKEYVAKATEISPKWQQVTRSTKSLDKEITQLKMILKEHESNHREEKVIRDYAEALALYKDKTNQVRDLWKFIDQLDNIMLDRQTQFKMMRRSLALRCKLYFKSFLIKMNCSGAIIFNHHNETISISINVPGESSDSRSDVRSLSGGERSFSTVCFMLCMWEITESPFRCLDEFDVYMDKYNRGTSLKLLLELSHRQHFRQFIFITPLTTSNLPKTSLIKIHQLLGTKKVQSQTEHEDV